MITIEVEASAVKGSGRREVFGRLVTTAGPLARRGLTQLTNAELDAEWRVALPESPAMLRGLFAVTAEARGQECKIVLDVSTRGDKRTSLAVPYLSLCRG